MLANPETLANLAPIAADTDPQETAEWRDSLEAVIRIAGTERAMFVSHDSGDHWVRLTGNLPT